MVETSDKVSPLSVAQITAAAQDAGAKDRPLAVARSGMTYSLERRVGIFAVDTTPELLVDAFIAHTDYDAVVTALSAVEGGWDVQYATSWSWVWWTDAAGFRVFTRADGEVGQVGADGATLRGQTIAPAKVVEVTLWADKDMVQRRLRVPFDSGEPVVVFAEDDETPLYDPGFDFIMLDTETAWLQDLGRALATALDTTFANRLRCPS